MQENGSKMFECTAENRNFCLLTDGIDQCLHTLLGGGDQGHVAQLFMHGFFLRRNGMNWDYVYAQSYIWYNAEIYGYLGLARKKLRNFDGWHYFITGNRKWRQLMHKYKKSNVESDQKIPWALKSQQSCSRFCQPFECAIL